jgi:hypothetical protein
MLAHPFMGVDSNGIARGKISGPDIRSPNFTISNLNI